MRVRTVSINNFFYRWKITEKLNVCDISRSKFLIYQTFVGYPEFFGLIELGTIALCTQTYPREFWQEKEYPNKIGIIALANATCFFCFTSGGGGLVLISDIWSRRRCAGVVCSASIFREKIKEAKKNHFGSKNDGLVNICKGLRGYGTKLRNYSTSKKRKIGYCSVTQTFLEISINDIFKEQKCNFFYWFYVCR